MSDLYTEMQAQEKNWSLPKGFAVVSVEDELPTSTGTYFILRDMGKIYEWGVASFVPDNWWAIRYMHGGIHSLDNITHWLKPVEEIESD